MGAGGNGNGGESQDDEPPLQPVMPDDPPVVGIGASAGGIRALQTLFESLPETTGLAYVVIVHLAPEHRSELPSILGARTAMPVIQVGDPVRLEADHVYVTPPDRRLEIDDDKISAQPMGLLPGQELDLISCRNLLIYLNRELQQQACSIFHYALKSGGFLLLGASESAENPPQLFATIHRDARIYQSIGQQSDRSLALPKLLSFDRYGNVSPGAGRGRAPGGALTEAGLHRLALEKVAPPSVIVDDMHRVIHLSDTAGRVRADSPRAGDERGEVRLMERARRPCPSELATGPGQRRHVAACGRLARAERAGRGSARSAQLRLAADQRRAARRHGESGLRGRGRDMHDLGAAVRPPRRARGRGASALTVGPSATGTRTVGALTTGASAIAWTAGHRGMALFSIISLMRQLEPAGREWA